MADIAAALSHVRLAVDHFVTASTSRLQGFP